MHFQLNLTLIVWIKTPALKIAMHNDKLQSYNYVQSKMNVAYVKV